MDAVYTQFNNLSNLSQQQLDAAKRQLKMQLSIYYESNEKRAELAKRLVLAGLPPLSSSSFVSLVDNVSLEDFKSVVKSVFSSSPVLVAEGNLTGLPTSQQLAKKFN